MVKLRSLSFALILLPLTAAAVETNPWRLAADELLASARLWDLKGRNDLARLALQKLLRAEPGNRVARARLAQLDAQEGKLGSAEAAYRLLLSDGPVGPNIRNLEASLRIYGPERQKLSAARLMVRAGRVDEAVRMLREVFPNGPPDGPIMIEYLRVIGGTGHGWAEAHAGYSKLARSYPEDMEFRLRLAELDGARPVTRSRALRTLAAMARAKEGNTADVMVAWHHVLLSSDHVSIAPQYYREYLALDPKDQGVADALAESEHAAAQRYFLAHDPTEIRLAHALAALADDQVDEADTGLRAVAEHLPHDPRVLGGLGRVALKRGNDDTAEKLFREALARDPANRAEWTSLVATARYWGLLKAGSAAREAGRLDEAEQRIREALAAQPNEPNGMAALGRVALARGDLDGADRVFRAVLAGTPTNSSAWQGRVDVAFARNRPDEARHLIADAPRDNPDLVAALAPVRAKLARKDAAALVAAGRTSDARLLLEATLLSVPGDVWLRYDLARIYTHMGKRAEARRAMDDAPASTRHGNAWRYANALVLGGLDEWDDALRSLRQIPESETDAQIRQLAREAQVRSHIADAQDAIAAQDEAGADAALNQATSAAGDDLALLAAVANAWADCGQLTRAQAMAAPYLEQPDDGDASHQLALANLADAARDDSGVGRQLAALNTLTLDADQTRQLQDLRVRLAARRAQAMLAQGNAKSAQATLQAALHVDPGNARLQNVLIDALEAGGDVPGALALARTRANTLPQDPDARLDLARLLAATGDNTGARREIATALKLAPEDDVDTRLGAARRLQALTERAQARAILSNLASTYPDDARVTLQQGRLADSEGDHYTAFSDFQQAAQSRNLREQAQAAIAQLYGRTAPYVATALKSYNKPGTAGVSSYDAREAPLEIRWRDGLRGRWFVQVDPTQVDSGTLAANRPDLSNQLGQSALLAPVGLASATHLRAQGTALEVGWQGDDWRADVGSTPLGFAVTSWVGGLRWSTEHGWGDTQLNLSRRPLASSVLAFAGLRDPSSGQTWGGVQTTGLDARWHFSNGPNSYTASGGVHQLTGRNVTGNSEADARLAYDRTLLNGTDAYVSAGTALTWWQYGHNLSNYTFGQGGYYSPQSYVSLTLPVEYDGRKGSWSWNLRGSVGLSQATTRDEPWYPTNMKLQAAAGNPVFAGGGSHGLSHSLKAALEYHATSKLRFGIEGSLDRSAYYAPNYIGAYLRYSLDGPDDAPRYPSNPVTSF